MFEWIWSHLPGSTPVRIVILLVAVLAIVALLFLVVFPWLTPLLPFTNVTLGAALKAPALLT